MKNRRNYYRILHVQPDAPMEIVRASYRTLMQKLRAHPDLGGDEWNASLLNQAYRVISDPVKRAQYDAKNQFFVKTKNDAHRADTLNENAAEPDSDKPQPPRPDTAAVIHCPFCKCSIGPSVSRYAEKLACGRCGNPLQKAERLHPTTTDKRSVMRMDAAEEVRFFSEWPQKQAHPGQLMDLSPNGMALLSPVWLPSMEVILIFCDLFSASARVVNCHARRGNPAHGYQVGAEFITLRFEQNQGTFVSDRI